ncbi:MAG: hypothetical protein AAFO01_12975, partial [Pseudomonadota bacterium]
QSDEAPCTGFSRTSTTRTIASAIEQRQATTLKPGRLRPSLIDKPTGQDTGKGVGLFKTATTTARRDSERCIVDLLRKS